MARRRGQNPPGSRQQAREAKSQKPKNLADVRWDGPYASFEFFALAHERPEDFEGSESDAVLMPMSDQGVSTTPQTHGGVVAAFAHGLVFTNQSALMVGVLALFGFPILVLGSFALFTEGSLLGRFQKMPFSALVGLISAVGALGLAWLMLRADITGYRYPAVLFDRAAGKVHFFIDDRITIRKPDGLYFRKSWLLWPLWGGGAHTILTFDWACIRAEVVKARIFTGVVAREEAQLRIVATKEPGGADVAASIGIGLGTTAMVVQPALDTWEHIRRFMQHEGPLFVLGDGPNPRLGREPLWQAPLFMQTIVGPGAMETWKEGSTADWLVSLFLMLCLPVLAPVGIARWICLRLKSEPKWPTEILASVGGAELRGSELEAWRSVVPLDPALTADELIANQRPSLPSR